MQDFGIRIAAMRLEQTELVGAGIVFGGFGNRGFSLLPVEMTLILQLLEALRNRRQLLDVFKEHLLDCGRAQAGGRVVERHVGAAVGEFRLAMHGGYLRPGKKARQRVPAKRDGRCGD